MKKIKNVVKTKVSKVKKVNKIKTLKVEKPSFKLYKKDILDEIKSEIINKTLHIKVIGKILVDYGCNNFENLKFIEVRLVKQGITIKRG